MNTHPSALCKQSKPFTVQTEGKKLYKKYLSKYILNNGMQFMKTDHANSFKNKERFNLFLFSQKTSYFQICPHHDLSQHSALVVHKDMLSVHDQAFGK